MAKRPWRTHLTRDWATDPFVRGLDLEARMVYLELLDIAWEEDGLKQDWITYGAYVAQRIGISRRKFVAIWPEIRAKFVESSPGIWSNPKLESERNRAAEFSEKQSNNAKQKKPKQANAEPQQSGVAQPPQPQSQPQPQKELSHARTKAPDQLWLEAVGLQPGAGLFDAWTLAKQAAPAKGMAPEEYFSKALGAFVAWVDGVRGARRPQKSPQKFVEHFARVQEILDGKREAVPTDDRPRSAPLAPSASFTEAGDKTAEYT